MATLSFPPPHPRKMTLGDKLHRLALLSRPDIEAIEVLVDDLLARRWPTYPPQDKEKHAA